MKKIILLIVLASLCLNFATKAQDNPNNITALKIGDKVPDITISNIINYKGADGKPTTTAKISDFKGKLLILDFWATWCSPCIAMIPKMDSLQKEFNGNVQFLSITYQSEKEVLPFFAQYEKQRARHYDLPIVTDEKELHRLFPHVSLPHYVWIDRNGVVQSITEAYYITKNNIAAMLKNGTIPAKVKIDQSIIYDRASPLFYNPTQASTNILKQTTWAGYIDGVVRGFDQNLSAKDENTVRRITARNQTIPELYRIAYRKEQNETVIETKDKAQLSFNTPVAQEFIEWLHDGHAYCYELVIDKSLSSTGRELMQRDLTGYFPNYQAAIEKRKIKCLALIRTSSIDKIRTSGGEPKAQFDGLGAKLTNCYLRVFLSRMKLYLQNNFLPLADETGYNEMVDLDLKADMSSVKELNTALQKYDLQFVEKEAVIDMLVIKDK